MTRSRIRSRGFQWPRVSTFINRARKIINFVRVPSATRKPASKEHRHSRLTELQFLHTAAYKLQSVNRRTNEQSLRLKLLSKRQTTRTLFRIRALASRAASTRNKIVRKFLTANNRFMKQKEDNTELLIGMPDVTDGRSRED